MTAQISKPLQKRIYSCALLSPKCAKAHVKLENRACRTVDIDVFITNAFVRGENAQARRKAALLGQYQIVLRAAATL
jgi:hypothetical protein